MNIDNLNRIADGLVGQVGGYNARTLLGTVAAGFLLGGLLGTWFGYLFLLLPLCLCLLGAGFLAYVKFRGEEGLGQSSSGGEIGQVRDPAGTSPPAPQSPTPSIPIPDGLSRLEHQIMERIGRNDGSLSVSAIAIELDVPRQTVQETIEDLAERGMISLE